MNIESEKKRNNKIRSLTTDSSDVDLNSNSKKLPDLKSERVKIYGLKCSKFSRQTFEKAQKIYKEKKKEIRHYLFVTSGVLFVVTLFQNFESSQVNFLFWQFLAPKIILFSAMIAIGMFLGLLLWRRKPIFPDKDLTKYSKSDEDHVL